MVTNSPHTAKATSLKKSNKTEEYQALTESKTRKDEDVLSGQQSEDKKVSYGGIIVKTARGELLKNGVEQNRNGAYLTALYQRSNEHLLLHTNESFVACPFIVFGCHKIGLKTEIQRHTRDDRIYHMMQLLHVVKIMKGICPEQRQFLASRVNALTERNNKVQGVLDKFGTTFVWKVSGIAQKVLVARSGRRPLVFSQPFITHRFGYQMVAILSLDKGSPGSMASIYVAITSSPFDPILCWPFRCPVHFHLCSSHNNPDTVTKVFDPQSVPMDLNLFGRPANGLKRNRAFGVQNIISVEALTSMAQEDSIFIKIDVDLMNLINKKSASISNRQCQGVEVPVDKAVRVQKYDEKADAPMEYRVHLVD